MKSAALIAALACVLTGCSSTRITAPTPNVTTAASAFVPGPCPKTPQPIPQLAKARCGQLTVPEDRAHPTGRTIRLSVAIIRAATKIAMSDPIVWIAGGPGDDAIIEIPLALAGRLNANRNVIFMSQRGTYTADPKLTCDSVDRWGAETLNMPYDAPATGRAYAVATRTCRREQATRTSDLGAYNTLESADDLEDLRVALHVAKWNIYGISYGTDLALTYMRRHPGGIRAAGIDGVFPPPLAGGTASWPSAAEGINAVFAACRAQTPCRQRYGDIAATWQQLVIRYEASPKTVQVDVPGHSGKVNVMISGGMLLQWAVSPGTHVAAKMPASIDALANGDPGPIASTWAGPKLDPAGIGVLSNGLFYGVSCGEWVPYETEQSVVDAGKRAFPAFPLSVWKNAPNLPFMRQNCVVWNVPSVSPDVRAVTQSSIPTLVVSAQYDAQTAASFGAYVARTLKNATVVTIPNVAHVAFGSPSAAANACAQSIVRSFFDVLNRVDTGCIEKVPPTEICDRTKTVVIVHLIDGTYELFRHFYGLQRAGGKVRRFGAAAGVCNTVLQMIEEGATHLGVATDHVIESFRNDLWDGYKTGEGIDPALFAQFEPLEDALRAMGVAVWAMVDLEADDALASAAAIASKDGRAEKICIWTPDKDLSQCVRGERIVQVDRRTKIIRDAAGVRAKFGVDPELIPDYLALVGDAADGYPGIKGIGAKGAASLLTRYGPIEDFPPEVLGEHRAAALLFKKLATLVTDAKLFDDVDEVRWRGPTARFLEVCDRLEAPALLERATKLAERV